MEQLFPCYHKKYIIKHKHSFQSQLKRIKYTLQLINDKPGEIPMVANLSHVHRNPRNAETCKIPQD